MATARTDPRCYLVCLADGPLGLRLGTFSLPNNAEVCDLIVQIQRTWGEAKALKKELIVLLKCGDLDVDPEDTLPIRIAEWLRNRTLHDRLKDNDHLCFHFPPEPSSADRMIDLVVAFPSILENRGAIRPFSERLAIKLAEDRISLLSQMKRLPSPADCAKSADAIKAGNDEAQGIHAHRPADNCGPPTVLFSPILAKLKHRLDHLGRTVDFEPSPELLEQCHLFIMRATEVYDDCRDQLVRQRALKSLIGGLVGEEGIWRYRADLGVVTWGYPVGMILTGEKECAGTALQGIITYTMYLSAHKHKKYCKTTNWPVVLISIAGTRIEISSAVFIDGVYVDKLHTEELCLGAWQSDNVLRLGRIMVCISRFFSELRDWQETLSSLPDLPPSISHLCPDPLPLEEGTRVPKLVYLSKLSHLGDRTGLLRIEKENEECKVRADARYIAKMILEDIDEDECGQEVLVVVKFTPRYNMRAHLLLAQRGLAPALYFCEPVFGGLFMIVMDLIQGEPLWIADVPPNDTRILEDVTSAVELLHTENLVFGDLRPQNIIAKAEGGALLIDFDIVGEDGKDRYPATLNNDERCAWADGVGRWTLMKKEHDLFMLEQLKGFLEVISSDSSGETVT